MRSLTIALFAFLLFSGNSFAQLSLNQVNHAANPGVTERGKYLKTGTFFLPDTGANKEYDYSGGIQSGDSVMPRAYLTSDNTTAFPGSNRYYVESIASTGFSFSASFYESNTTSAHGLIGYALEKRQGFDISSFSGTKGDSVIFIKQAHLFKTPNTILAYPAAYKSNWGYANRVVTNFLLNLHYSVFFKYDYDSCERVQTITHQDSVVGWGKMKVPFGTTGSAEYDVIMVKYWEKVNDSFLTYDNSQHQYSPTNPIILTALGMTNGKDTFTYGYKFYRPFFSDPLMVISTDPSYSKTTAAYYDPDHIGITGIASNSLKISAVNVYPNPSSNGNFTLEFDKLSNEKYTVSVINLLGQKITDKTVSGTGHQQVNVQLTENSGSGVYFYGIFDAIGEIISQGKLVK